MSRNKYGRCHRLQIKVVIYNGKCEYAHKEPLCEDCTFNKEEASEKSWMPEAV